jgi:hypothetical protein
MLYDLKWHNVHTDSHKKNVNCFKRIRQNTQPHYETSMASRLKHMNT